MKKIATLLFLLLASGTFILQAQTFEVAGCSGTLGSNVYGPMYSVATANATSRTAVIYPSSQLAGIAGVPITSIYFNRLTATGSMAGNPNFKIYLKEVTALDWGTGALDWATAIAGATLVFDGDPAPIVGTTAGWKSFPTTAAFTFTGSQNLAVLTEYKNPTASTAITWVYEYTAPCITTANNNTTKYSNVTSGVLPASLGSSNYRRPYIGFDLALSCFPPTNISVTNITGTTATVSWTAPGAPPSGYEYYYSTSDTPPVAGTTPSGSTAAGVTSADISGLTIATLYYVYVRSRCGASERSPWTSATVFGTLPPNDACSGSINITTQPLNATCTSPTAAVTTGANASTVTETSCVTATSDNDDIFYTFTATAVSQKLQFSDMVATTGTATALGYHIYSGTCGSLTQLPSCDISFGSGGAGSTTITGLTIGTVYYLQLFTAGTDNSATFNFCIQDIPAAPANDECAGATSMPLTTFGSPCNFTAVNTTGSTMSTTTGQLNTCTSTGINDDLFYTFTTTAAGIYTFSYAGLTATTGTASSVGFNLYTGSCGTLTAVTGACDAGFGSGGSGTTTIVLAATTTYTLRLWVGAADNSGTFNFCITAPTPAPTNDECSGAIALPTPSTTATCATQTAGSTSGATASIDAAPTCSATGANDDVFFSFVATATTHTVLLSDETSTTASAIYSGNCGSLTQIANACGTGGAAASGLTIGNTYYVRVYTTSTVVGTSSNFNICVVSGAPVNNDCGGAISLTPSATNTCANPVSGTTIGASQSADAVPTCSATGINDDVFYSFIATSTSHAVIISNATTTTAAAVYSGSCGSLTFIANACGSGTTGSALATGLTIGSTYFIRVYSTSSTVGTYSNFDICVISAPTNDNCSGAQALTVSSNNSCSSAILGSTAGATPSSETAPGCSATGVNDDVFYSFVATATTHTVALFNTSTTMAAAVYSGSCGALVQVANACASTNMLAAGLTIGDTYFIRVYSTSSTAGLYGTFKICVGVLPANDDCSGAISLIASADATCNAVAGTTIGATATAGETTPTCSATGSNDDVFYSFVATATTHIVTLIDPSTTTAAQIYSGSCGSLVGIACASTTATATSLTIGNTYYVRVYSTSTTAGIYSNFDICITGPPANDDCPQATALTNGVVVTGSTVGATQSMAPALCTGSTATAALDVFYQFTPAQNGTATITLTNASSVFDGVVEAFSGSCGTLTSLGCVDVNASGGNETLVLNALVAGQTYFIRVYDFSGTGTFSISYSQPNSAPVVMASAGSTGYTSGTPVIIDGSITVTDANNANLASATVSITGGFQASEDVLLFTNQNGITGTYNAATGILSLTGSSSVVNYQAALRSILYSNSSLTPNTSDRTISFQVNDGLLNSNITTKVITITSVNNAPVVTTSVGNTGYTSGIPVLVDAAVIVTDADNANLVSAIVSITGNFQGGQDVLLFTNQNGITGTYNPATGVLNLTGSSSVANYQAALRSILYNNTSITPNTANRTISFQVNDGTTNSNVATKTITVTAVNNPPVVTASGGNTAFTEGTPIVVDAAITVTDADNVNLVSATVSITTGFQTTEDVLLFTNQNGITGTYNAATGVLSLSGTSSVTNYQLALRSLRYNNTSSAPNTANRVVSFMVNDGSLSSNISTKTITVTAVNTAPIVTASAGNTAYTEGSTVIIDAAVTVTDADNANLASASVSVTSGFQSGQDMLLFTNQNGITGTYNAATGILTLTGSSSVSNYQAALRSVQYNNTSSNPNTTNRVVSFQVNDGTTNSNVSTKTITITAVNTAPVITASAGNTVYTEGSTISVDNAITVTDVDNANLVSATVSITGGFQSGEDVLVFANQNGITGTYNATTGVLALTGSSSVSNYQTALRSVQYNNTSSNPNTANRVISFQVNDGTTNSNVATKTVTITAVNNAPVVTASGGNTGYVSGTPVAVDSAIRVTDADNANMVSATVSITGGFQSSEDVLVFVNQNGITGTYNAGTGVLTLTGSSSLANYQTALQSVRYNNTSLTPNIANRTISFQVNDGTTNSNIATKTVTITAVNNPPVVTAFGTVATYFASPVIVNAGVTVTDLDNANLVSATVSIIGNFQSNQDVLLFTNQNGITGTYNAATGILSLTGSSSVANYQAALRSVQYNNTSLTPNTTTRTISFRVNDGTDNSNISASTVAFSLSAFTVQVNNCLANLRWTTVTEQNSSLFEIQRSNDGINFDVVGTVPASGNSATLKDYNFTTYLVNQRNYFRLRLVSLDGSSQLSGIISVDVNCTDNIITLFPNPTKDFVKILSSVEIVSVQVLDRSGRLLRKMTLTPDNRYNVSGLFTGVYFIRVEDKEKVTVHKLLVQ